MPPGCSMTASIRMAPAQRGQPSGSTSEACVMMRAQTRFAFDAGIENTLRDQGGD
jgi:hypothetical protein